MGISVTVIGHPGATAILEQAGCNVHRNEPPKAGDLVIVAVSGREGVMPLLANPLDLAADFEARAAAILLTHVEGVDQELLELVEIETKEWLDGKVLLYPVACQFPVLRSDDPELRTQIASIVQSSSHPIRFLAPPRQVSFDFRRKSSQVLQIAQISARFAFAEGSRVTFSDAVEVSLDCCICQRCCRTVLFKMGEVEGKCTPTGHPFPGKIVDLVATADSVVYRIEYWYEPFEDAKYRERRKAQDRPTWGRVVFEVACPECGQESRQASQNNIVRPRTCHCKCGRALFTESDEMPVLS